MAEFLLNLLKQSAARDGEPGPCPTGRQLLALDPPPARDLARHESLARHILGCADCANRWELIQADPHLDLTELYVLERLDEDSFASLRARRHLRRCPSCQHHERALGNLVVAESLRSVHYGNLVTLLRQGPEPALALRSGGAETLPAVVLRENGEPYLRGNEIERSELRLQRALLTEEGRLTIELQVPPDYSQAQLAVSGEQLSVMFPPTHPRESLAQFVADTHVRGPERRLATSQLAAWVTRP